MPDRVTPYGAFNFLVEIDGIDGPIGGFSDVSGLSTDITVAEYRNGNDAENHVRKVPGIHKVADVTCKRGVVKSNDIWDWINDVRVNGINAQRQVVITLRDEAGQPVQAWTLRNAIPLKYTGPTLAAKGGGDVAMEELVISSEGLTLNE
jgi:phage tail-like protein